MAVGDVFDVALTSVANGGTLDIKPSAGVEAVIHNIYYGGAVQFRKRDATNYIQFDSDASAGAIVSAAFHVTNTRYLQVVNVSGASIFIHADGIQTK